MRIEREKRAWGRRNGDEDRKGKKKAWGRSNGDDVRKGKKKA